MSIGTEHIIVNDATIAFREDDHTHAVYLRRPVNLTQDVYIDLPTRNGVTIGPTYVVKATSESVVDSSTLQDDNDLTIPVVAGRAYEGRMGLFVSGTSICASLTGTGTSTVQWIDETQVQSSTDSQTATGVSTGAVIVIFTFLATATGTLKLEWAQNVSGGTPAVLAAGSYIAYQEIVP